MIWTPTFDRVEPPYWDDKPVLIVGTGPSLKDFDHSRVEGLGYVLAVKQAWRNLPFADAVFGLDIPWMEWERENITDLAQRIPLYLAVPDQRLQGERIPGAIYLVRSRETNSMSDIASKIESGGNSGHGALNLAWLKQAKTIFLFGYDYDGVHHTPEHYAARKRPENANSGYLKRWARNFDPVRRQADSRGIEIFNASPESSVTAFKKVTHEQALEHLHRLRRARG